MNTITDNTQVVSLLFSLTGFGQRDISQAAEWLDEAQVEYSEFAKFVASYCEDTGTSLLGLDIPAQVLDFIAQEAGAEELREHVHSNSICSMFDLDADEAGRILDRVPVHERGAAWDFLVELIGAELPEDDFDDVFDVDE